MRVGSFIVAACVLPLALCLPQSSLAQAPAKRITIKVARSVRKKEPEWRYVVGFCTCPPLLPSQISDDEASWFKSRVDSTSERVSIQIHVIGNQKEAVGFMSSLDAGHLRFDSLIHKYELGDEAFLIDDSAKNIANPIQIWLRKDHFIIHVDGSLAGTVIRFAQYALKDLPVSPS